MASTGTQTQAGTITRTDALIRQINLIVQATTGSTTFRNIIEQAVKNQWIQSVTINGLNKEGKIRQQIIVELDWNEHSLKLKDNNGQIIVNLASDERNQISKVIGQIIDGFNEITEQGELEAVWLISYTPEANMRRDEINNILGLRRAEQKIWESGPVELMLDQYRPNKLSEMSLSWKVVTKQ